MALRSNRSARIERSTIDGIDEMVAVVAQTGTAEGMAEWTGHSVRSLGVEVDA